MLDPNDLLRDARLLSSYASRRGLLPDSKLQDAIAVADSKVQANSFGVADEQKLQEAINDAVKLVAPVTIEKLRAYEEYASAKQSKGVSFKRIKHVLAQVSVSAICILLIIVIIPLTTSFNRLSVSMAEVKTLGGSNYFDQLHHVRTLYEAKQTEDEDLREQLHKLRDMDSKLSMSLVSHRPLFDLETGVPNWVAIIFGSYGFAGKETVKVVAAVDEAAQAQDEVAQAEPTVVPAEVAEIVKDGQFAQSLGLYIIEPSALQTTFIALRQAEALGLLLGGSILPLLYGLLGASVYLMRSFLTREGLELFAPQLEARAFIRLGLGAIAGLTIGWFWVPDGAAMAPEVAHLSSAPFALAFLAGFSIELVFSLIDRIVAALSPSSTTASAPAA